jgi:hypothetical protein
MALKVGKKDSSKKGSSKEGDKDDEILIFDVKVLRAKEIKDAITFDVRINGVTIYGCWYRVYEDREKPGEETGFVSFPSRKGTDGKWYSYAYIKIDKDNMTLIEKQIEELLK